MQIKQISIFIANKSGRLVEVAEKLAEAGVDLRAFSIADTSDYGILRIIADKPDVAVDTLRAAGMTVSLTRVIAVGIDDKPGAFAGILRVLADADINVEYMYAFISRDPGRANIIIRAEDNQKAIDALIAHGITPMCSDELR